MSTSFVEQSCQVQGGRTAADHDNVATAQAYPNIAYSFVYLLDTTLVFLPCFQPCRAFSIGFKIKL